MVMIMVIMRGLLAMGMMVDCANVGFAGNDEIQPTVNLLIMAEAIDKLCVGRGKARASVLCFIFERKGGELVLGRLAVDDQIQRSLIDTDGCSLGSLAVK